MIAKGKTIQANTYWTILNILRQISPEYKIPFYFSLADFLLFKSIFTKLWIDGWYSSCTNAFASNNRGRWDSRNLDYDIFIDFCYKK